jgi:general L-amino acid transport system permease protein
VRKILQGALLGALGFLCLGLFLHAENHLKKSGLSLGFDFLGRETGFAISESLLSYKPSDTYLWALVAGGANTLKVAVLGNILSLILGLILGMMLLSTHKLTRKLVEGWISVLRNVPLLLQLLFWYGVFMDVMPSIREATPFLGQIFVTNRGIYFPWISAKAEWVHGLALFLTLMSLLIIIVWPMFVARYQKETGKGLPLFWPPLASVFGMTAIGILVSWRFINIDRPALEGFNFSGGLNMTPEFAALLFGLVFYTSTYVAEIVRAGILAVDDGQWEAASALGLKREQTLALVIIPQGLRVMVPSLIGQVLNLTKNSSLAVVIAYPDIVAVSNTVINQTGQAIECVALIMFFYLSFSLATSWMMNKWNQKILFHD